MIASNRGAGLLDGAARDDRLPPAASAGLAPRPLVSNRYRDRDFLLRRLLLLADLSGVAIALFAALLLSGHSRHPWEDGVWILLTLPAWGMLFRIYGLYDRQMRRFEPTRSDDLWPLFHAVMVACEINSPRSSSRRIRWSSVCPVMCQSRGYWN